MKLIQFIIKTLSIIFPVVFILLPGVILVLLGNSFQAESDLSATIMIILGALLIIMSIAVFRIRLQQHTSNDLNDHIENYFAFDDRTLQQNAAGKLTTRQILRLGFSTLVTAGCALIFGIPMIIAALNTLINSYISSTIAWLGIFGLGLTLYAAKAIFSFSRDIRSPIQQVTGTLSIAKTHKERNQARGTSNTQTRHYLHIHPQDNTEQVTPKFAISQHLFQQIQSQTDQQAYTVYYLPRTKSILSMKAANPK